MINIVFLISNIENSGGTQRMLSLLCNKLAHNFNVWILINKDGEPFYDLHKNINIVSLSHFENLLLKNIYIYKFLNKNESDYFVCLDSNSLIFNGLFLPKKTRLIIWEHFSLSKNNNKLLFKVSRFYAAIRAYKFILLSKQEIVDWRKRYYVSQNKLRLIYNPVTIKKIDHKNPNELFHNKKVLAIGNDISVKGFDYLLEVWSLFNKNGWTLEIVGLSEEEIIKLNLIASKYVFKNEIMISGKITNIEEKYLESSIYCLTSRMEATPLVLIESQYVGLPAVVFDNCTGVLELLNESAEIIKYPNLITYKEGLERLMSSSILYDKVSSNARNNSKSFGKDLFYEKWLSILN